MDDIGRAIGEGIAEVRAWLVARRIPPSGPPLIRYRVIDMAGLLQIEVGWPVAQAVELGDGLVSDTLPAGTYATLTYRNAEEGIAGNAALIQWARDKRIELARRDSPEGDRFAARVEFELSDPHTEPDRSKWLTEVAILVAASG